MKLLCLVVFLLMWVNQAAGREIMVKTGDHPEFTRVVFGPWSEGKIEISTDNLDKKIKVFTKTSSDFNIRNFFKIINKIRIKSVEKSTNSLLISLACNCQITSFNDGRFTVLDVSDNSGDLKALYKVNERKLSWNSVRNLYSPAAAYRSFFLTRNLMLKAELNASSIWEVAESRRNERTPEDGVKFELLSLETEVLAAANSGLLKTRKRTNIERRVDEIGGGSANLLDRLFDDVHMEIICLSPGDLGLEKWLNSDFEDDRNLELNVYITDEFGEIDQSRVRALVRNLIFNGMGVESISALRFYKGEDEPVLRWVSEIISGVGVKDRVRNIASCSETLGIWHILASDDKILNFDNITQVIEEFEYLPANLKKILGFRLVEKLKDLGHHEAAGLIVDALIRKFGYGNNRISVVSAELEVSRGNNIRGRRVLKKVIKENSEPEILEKFITASIVSGVKIEQKYLNLASAYTNEYRDTELGSNVWLSLVKGLLLNGSYDAAYNAIIEGSLWVAKLSVVAAIDDFTASVLKYSDDGIFLKYFWGQDEWFYQKISEELKLAASERLLNLGFPEEVRLYSNSGGVDREARKFKLMEARSFLSQGKGREAEITLGGLNGEDVSKLRAEARRLLGDNIFASALYASIGDHREASFSAWIAGDWSSPYIKKTENLSEFSEFLIRGDLLADVTDIDLGKSILNEAATARQKLRQMISAGWNN